MEKLFAIAKKSDEALSCRLGYETTAISTALTHLIERGCVEVGYRSSCGRTDPTAYIYREWQKILKAAQKAGLGISAAPVKHGNAYATSKGGFWSSSVYSLSGKKGGA